MTEARIRAAKMADEEALLELAQQEMKAQEARDPRFRLREDAKDRYALYLRGRMRDLDSSLFAAEADGAVVGMAIGTVRKQDSFFEVRRFGYVSDLVVAPGVRRRGIGRQLYERVALWFRGMGIEVVRLHVAVRSPDAREFWRSLGAEEFLAEAWIDLEQPGAVPSASAGAEAAPGAMEPEIARGGRPAERG